MKRLFSALVAASLLVALAVVPMMAAAGGVARNQVTTNTYTMAIGYGHTYNVVISPCNGGTVSASGWQWGADLNPATHNPDETITATLSADGTMLTFNPAVYVGGWAGSPYSWSGTFPVVGGTFTITDSNGSVYSGVAITRTATSVTTWTNHGDYVSAQGGGDDAAHSCIGMPIVAH
jgi:hypothetical protein